METLTPEQFRKKYHCDKLDIGFDALIKKHGFSIEDGYTASGTDDLDECIRQGYMMAIHPKCPVNMALFPEQEITFLQTVPLIEMGCILEFGYTCMSWNDLLEVFEENAKEVADYCSQTVQQYREQTIENRSFLFLAQDLSACGLIDLY